MDSSSSTDEHFGDDHTLLDESVSNSEFHTCLVDDVIGQSPQSFPLARSFSMSTDGWEALDNHEMVLDLLKEQKREKDCQIEELKKEKEELKREKAELKLENAELKAEVREYKSKQTEMNQCIERLQSEKQEVIRRLDEKERVVDTFPFKDDDKQLERAQPQPPSLESMEIFRFAPGEHYVYVQCAATKCFLTLRGRNKHLLLDDTKKMIPTLSGLLKLVQNQDGNTALYSSLNGMQLKVNSFGCIVTVSQEDTEAGKDFVFVRNVGSDDGQLIIGSLQTDKFVRVSNDKSLRADADGANPMDIDKFILISSASHLGMIERYLQPNVDYFLKDAETSSINCFIGIISKNRREHELVLTSEANKKPLKLFYNSKKSISFYSPTARKWLGTSGLNLLLDQSIGSALEFEPLIEPDKSDGIVLRSVQSWENLRVCYELVRTTDGKVQKGLLRHSVEKFNFLPVN